MKNCKSVFGYVVGLLFVILLFAVAFFSLAIALNKNYKFGLSDDSIVIAFVGIMATFVVVSNYVQLKQSEDKVEECSKKIKQLEDDLRKIIVDRKTVMLASGVKEEKLDLNEIEGIDVFNGVEIKYTILRGDKTRQGTIFGNAVGGFTEINAIGDCENVWFDLKKTNGVILIKKDGEQNDKVIIRFLIIGQ